MAFSLVHSLLLGSVRSASAWVRINGVSAVGSHLFSHFFLEYLFRCHTLLNSQGFDK